MISGTRKEGILPGSSLSAYSFRDRAEGDRDFSVFYAYDPEQREFVCAQRFPGSCTDAASLPLFIRENHLEEGIVLADRGSPLSGIREDPGTSPEPHYLRLLERDDPRIRAHDMLHCQGVLKGVGEGILFRKQKLEGERDLFLYAFLDTRREEAQLHSCVPDAEQGKKEFNEQTFDMLRASFGTAVFESDLDMDPETACLCCRGQRQLELILKQYRSDDGLSAADVPDDFSVYGSEFINYIAALITGRIIRKAGDLGLLKAMTYGGMMDRLRGVRRYSDAPISAEPPTSRDAFWDHTLKDVSEVMEALGLSRAEPALEVRKRGRPPGKKPEDASGVAKGSRKRGRPSAKGAGPADASADNGVPETLDPDPKETSDS